MQTAPIAILASLHFAAIWSSYKLRVSLALAVIAVIAVIAGKAEIKVGLGIATDGQLVRGYTEWEYLGGYSG